MLDSQMTVDQAIGEDYKAWEKGTYVFIDAPTGSGKTTFILNTLLPHYSAGDQKILYLVNRRILKEQIKEMIMDLPCPQREAIQVELYQEIEKGAAEAASRRGRENSNPEWLKKLSAYDCVVCDECHYFLTDSTYNTNTIFSFQWVQENFGNKISIFMSATIRDLESYMAENDFHESGRIETAQYKIPKYDPYSMIIRYLRWESETETRDATQRIHEKKSYRVDRDYSYIKPENIRIFMDRKELVDIVAEGSRKWLIFIDNIHYGKALYNSIKKRLREQEKKALSESETHKVIMISSGYKRDQKESEEVDRIIRTSVPSAKVLIATSVLDNGVNIKDIDVRNVVLFADTKTEFIQMLGRKRKDAQHFKLYIYGYDQNHFNNRKWQLRKQKEIVDRYLNAIKERVNEVKDIKKQSEEERARLLNEEEKRGIEDQHERIMRQLCDGSIKFEDVRHVFTALAGMWYLNMVSFQQIENLSSYFQDIIKKFEMEGEDAYAREQLRWLGKTGKIAEKIITASKQTRENESRSRVTAALREIAGKKMIREEYKKLTDEMLTDLRVVVAHPVDFPSEMERTNEQFEKWNTIKREFSKAGKVLSKQSMEFLRTYCRIPFQLDNDRKGGYMVRFVNQEGEDV